MDASPTFHSPGHKAGCWAGIQAVPVGLGTDLESRKVRLGQQPGVEWAQPAAGAGLQGQGEVGTRWEVESGSSERRSGDVGQILISSFTRGAFLPVVSSWGTLLPYL